MPLSTTVGSCGWGPKRTSHAYFLQRLAEYRLGHRELPHLTFGTGASKTLRLFPEEFPIGVDPIADRYVFTYLVTRRVPVDFRAFLVRHITMLKTAAPVDSAGARPATI